MAINRRYRSFFWPLLLIVIGVLALLIDLNVISADRAYRLADLWPLILIVIGLELIARRTLQGSNVDIATALILLIAAGGAIAYVSVGPAIPGGTQTFDTSGPTGGLDSATLHVDVGAGTVTVDANGSLGADLYRAHVEYSGPKPKVTFDTSTGDLRFSQQGGFEIFGNRRFTLTLQINSAATWSFDVNSGAATDTFRLSGVRVGTINVNTGASREDITLGPPKGMVPITINGGALTVNVHRPPGTEVSAQVSGGAVSLSGDGQQDRGIGSRSWQTDGYDTAADAYTIQVNGGACTVNVDTHAPSS